MPKKIELKTSANKDSVTNFINNIENPEKKKDAKTLLALMKKVTEHKPIMWGPSIVGFDSYEYKRKNGDVGTFFATGFSPRKNALTIYIMPGYQDYSSLTKKLGKHTLGKSCLYIKQLSDIDLAVLETLVRRGYTDLKKMYPKK